MLTLHDQNNPMQIHLLCIDDISSIEPWSNGSLVVMKSSSNVHKIHETPEQIAEMLNYLEEK
jgi:hypothetical protein